MSSKTPSSSKYHEKSLKDSSNNTSDPNKRKVHVEVFIPNTRCARGYAKWIDEVWQIVVQWDPHLIEFSTETTDHPKAKQLGVHRFSKFILVNDELVKQFRLKSKLIELLGEPPELPLELRQRPRLQPRRMRN